MQPRSSGKIDEREGREKKERNSGQNRSVHRHNEAKPSKGTQRICFYNRSQIEYNTLSGSNSIYKYSFEKKDKQYTMKSLILAQDER